MVVRTTNAWAEEVIKGLDRHTVYVINIYHFAAMYYPISSEKAYLNIGNRVEQFRLMNAKDQAQNKDIL